MEATEFETDEMLKLLVEALRRGPGSPEWHDAIERLRDSGVAGADEYRLLMTVRERLESGQSYREVRAGPGFTRDLFDKINDDGGAGPAGPGKPRTAFVVGLISLILLIGSAAILMKLLSNGQPAVPSVESLAQRLFVTPQQQLSFESAMPLSIEQSGSLKLEVAGGLRTTRGEKPGSAAAYSKDQVALTPRGVCVEGQLRFRPGGSTLASVVARDNTGTADKPNLAIALRDDGFEVIVAGQRSRVSRTLPAGKYTLRIKLDERNAIVEVDGQPIWSGPHQLTSPVLVGVTLDKAAKGHDDNRVLSLSVLGP